ncbi:MAG: hypothetical protein ACI8W8_003630 [Rhodothermales bacterium]
MAESAQRGRFILAQGIALGGLRSRIGRLTACFKCLQVQSYEADLQPADLRTNVTWGVAPGYYKSAPLGRVAH